MKNRMSLKILGVLVILWAAPAALLQADSPAAPSPVYFPISLEDFKEYGIKVPSGRNVLPRTGDDLPTTTSKPSTTTAQLPIAQRSHVSPPLEVTERPGISYLTESPYYIPGVSSGPHKTPLDHQDISGRPKFEDEDRGNSFATIFDRDDEDYDNVGRSQEERGHSALGHNSNRQVHDRFGVFFIDEHESFAGSEEDLVKVPPGSLYISPSGSEDVERDNTFESLQSLPEAPPSALSVGNRVSVETPGERVYNIPSQTSPKNDSPEVILKAQYQPPHTTERSYLRSSTAHYETPGSYEEQGYDSLRESDPEAILKAYDPPRLYEYEPPQFGALGLRYSAPTTTERVYITTSPAPTRSYTSARTTTPHRTYTSARTHTPRTYNAAPVIVPSTTTEQSYRLPKLVSVRRYTGLPSTTSGEKLAIPQIVNSKKSTPSSSRSRARYTSPTTSIPSIQYRAPVTEKATPNVEYRAPVIEHSRQFARYKSPISEEPTHAVYFLPTRPSNKSSNAPLPPTSVRVSSSSKQRDSTKIRERQGSRRTYLPQPILESAYSLPQNVTVKLITVSDSSSATSSQRSNTAPRVKPAFPSASRSSSRSSSSYKLPSVSLASSERGGKMRSVPRYSDSRAGSKYQFPVYRTSDTAFQAPSSLYPTAQHSTEVAAAAQPDFVQAGNNLYIPHEYDASAIPGEAGIDYPALARVPDTDFDCTEQQHPGLYADTDARCQVFHICQKSGQHDSFLCPIGTVFNQQYFVCDWWYNFSCDNAVSFFGLNQYIYELPEREDYRGQD